jgi:hypothetical protein
MSVRNAVLSGSFRTGGTVGLEAEDDDALCAVVREHLIWWHPTLEPSEEQAQQIVSSRAYNIEYADEHVEEEEEVTFEPY